jgi:hypothetical protein
MLDQPQTTNKASAPRRLKKFRGNYSNGTNSEINYKNGTNSEINHKMVPIHSPRWHATGDIFVIYLQNWYHLSKFPKNYPTIETYYCCRAG